MEEIQGQVYGKYMHLAKVSNGFENFIIKSKFSDNFYQATKQNLDITIKKLGLNEALKWIKKKIFKRY